MENPLKPHVMSKEHERLKRVIFLFYINKRNSFLLIFPRRE